MIAKCLVIVCLIGMLASGAVWAYSIYEWFNLTDKLSDSARAVMDRQFAAYVWLASFALSGMLVCRIQILRLSR